MENKNRLATSVLFKELYFAKTEDEMPRQRMRSIRSSKLGLIFSNRKIGILSEAMKTILAS